MSKSYDPHAWYWQASDGRVFGSAAGDLVSDDDPDFEAWTGDGTSPTAWPTDEAGEPTLEALDAVLAPFGLAASLPAAKRLLAAAIDTKAERIRLALITPGSGQAMEYGEAQDQAAAALKSPSAATSAKYPMLAASIGLDIDPQTGAPAADVLGVARSVQAARDLWLVIGSEIRGARLSGKRAVEEAGSVAAAQAAAAAVAWPTLA